MRALLLALARSALVDHRDLPEHNKFVWHPDAEGQAELQKIHDIANQQEGDAAAFREVGRQMLHPDGEIRERAKTLGEKDSDSMLGAEPASLAQTEPGDWSGAERALPSEPGYENEGFAAVQAQLQSLHKQHSADKRVTAEMEEEDRLEREQEKNLPVDPTMPMSFAQVQHPSKVASLLRSLDGKCVLHKCQNSIKDCVGNHDACEQRLKCVEDDFDHAADCYTGLAWDDLHPHEVELFNCASKSNCAGGVQPATSFLEAQAAELDQDQQTTSAPTFDTTDLELEVHKALDEPDQYAQDQQAAKDPELLEDMDKVNAGMDALKTMKDKIKDDIDKRKSGQPTSFAHLGETPASGEAEFSHAQERLQELAAKLASQATADDKAERAEEVAYARMPGSLAETKPGAMPKASAARARLHTLEKDLVGDTKEQQRIAENDKAATSHVPDDASDWAADPASFVDTPVFVGHLLKHLNVKCLDHKCGIALKSCKKSPGSDCGTRLHCAHHIMKHHIPGGIDKCYQGLKWNRLHGAELNLYGCATSHKCLPQMVGTSFLEAALIGEAAQLETHFDGLEPSVQRMHAEVEKDLRAKLREIKDLRAKKSLTAAHLGERVKRLDAQQQAHRAKHLARKARKLATHARHFAKHTHKATSLAQTSGFDLHNDKITQMKAQIKASESQMKADSESFAAYAKSKAPSDPSSFAEISDSPDDGFAKVEAKLKALEEKMKADAAKFEAEAKAPSSFAEISESAQLRTAS